MADVTVKRHRGFEAIFGGGFRRVRAGLGVSSFGIAVIDLPPNFTTTPTTTRRTTTRRRSTRVLAGRATLGSAAEEIELEPGVWVRVGPDEKRKIITGDEPARVLAIGGTPGEVYRPPEFTEEGAADRR